MFEVADAHKWVRYQDLIGTGEPRQHPAGARAPAESVACRSPPARGEQPHGELRLHGYPRCRLFRYRNKRHTFVTRRLLRWYQAGADVDLKILALATYLGHAKVTDTYWYCTAVPELLASTSQRFERFAHRVPERRS